MKCIVKDHGRYGFHFVNFHHRSKQVSVLSIDTKAKWLKHEICTTIHKKLVTQVDIIFNDDDITSNDLKNSTVSVISESRSDSIILGRHTSVISGRYGLHLAFVHIPRPTQNTNEDILYDTWNGTRHACRYPRRKKGAS